MVRSSVLHKGFSDFWTSLPDGRKRALLQITMDEVRFFAVYCTILFILYYIILYYIMYIILSSSKGGGKPQCNTLVLLQFDNIES